MTLSSEPRKWLLVAAKAAVTVGAGWLIASKVDFGAVTTRIKDADLAGLIVAAALIFGQIAMNSGRWRRFLRLDDIDLAYGRAYRFYMESMFFNQALPGSVGGDVIRIYRVRPFCRGLGQAINSVVLDRLTGLAGISLLILAALPMFLPQIQGGNALVGLGAAFAFGATGIVGLLALARLPEAGPGGRLRGAAVRFARLFERLARRPADLGPVLLLAVATHIITVLIAYIAAGALGLDYGFLDCLMIVPTAILLSTLPVSLGGWGVREGAMAVGFQMIGADPAGAIALSITIGLVLLTVGLVGGAVWLLSGAVVPDDSNLSAVERGK